MKIFKCLGALLICSLISTVSLQSCRQPNPILLHTEPLTATGSLLQTRVGKNFEIVLPSLGAHPRYHWVLKELSDERLVRVLEEKRAISEYLDRAAPADYAPNTIFSFEALASGNCQLVFAQALLSDEEQYSGVERHFEIQIEPDVVLVD